MTHTFNVVPTKVGEGVAGMLVALGEARIEVRSVSANGSNFVLKVDAPLDKAEPILEAIGYAVDRSVTPTATAA